MLKFAGNTDNENWADDVPNEIKVELANGSTSVLFLNYFDIQISPGEIYDPPQDSSEVIFTEDTATVTTEHSHENG